MTRLSVLYVDDDRSNLLAMQYALGDQLDLRIAQSGDEALELAEGIDVLVADQRMPGMSGIEVCRRFRELNPSVTRILYTAFADAHAGVAAINEGGVSRLLIKPVLNEDLLAAILDSHESQRRSRLAVLQQLSASSTDRARRSLERTIGRSISGVMPALYDHATDREAEKALRTMVVSLQAGATMAPLDLSALDATGIPVMGRAIAALDLDSLLHALVLVDPAAIELHEDGDLVRIVLRTDSVARDTTRVASALLERGGAHVVARDGDLILTASKARDPIDCRAPRLRAPSLDVLIVGEHSSYRDVLTDLAVAWTDAAGAMRRVHDARVIVIDERNHDSSLCRELRKHSRASVLLRAAAPDFIRHGALAGVIDCLVHDAQSAEERSAILRERVGYELQVDMERAVLLRQIREGVQPAMKHAAELQIRLASRTEPLLTSTELRDAWRSCEDRSWRST